MKNSSTRHLQWKCRRGMLEIDLLLEEFLDNGYAQLSAHEQKAFELLLESPDPVLFDWLLGSEVPENKETLQLIGKIRA